MEIGLSWCKDIRLASWQICTIHELFWGSRKKVFLVSEIMSIFAEIIFVEPII